MTDNLRKMEVKAICLMCNKPEDIIIEERGRGVEIYICFCKSYVIPTSGSEDKDREQVSYIVTGQEREGLLHSGKPNLPPSN